jgi:hypothetical protein
MKKKKLFLVFVLIIIVAILGFGLYGWNDKITIVDYLNSGGEFTTYIPAYNPTGDEVPVWIMGTNMPAPTRYHGSGVTYTRNDTSWLYCLGGDETGGGAESFVLSIYNITTNTWSTGALQPPPAVFYNMSARLGDTIYQMGGRFDGFGDDYYFVVQKYHIPTNTWSAGRNLPISTMDAECEAYQDSIIYIIGGFYSEFSPQATNQVRLYNRVSGYRPATPLPAARSGHASAIIGDTIVVVCGGTGYNAGLTNIVFKGLISQSDRSTITWTTAAATYPGTSRHRFDGDKWGSLGMIIGHGSGSGFGTTTECYRYSPGLDVFTQLPSAPTLTSAAFYGSVKTSTNLWRWVVASGLVLSPPYSIPQVQILRDTLNTPVAINTISQEIPASFELYQNYPNPFNPSTNIKFQIPNAGFVKLIVFDILGREASTLVNEELKAGIYEVNWDASGYPSGVYFYRLITDKFTETRKVMLIK